MKGIAIGFSYGSTEILKRLEKTEFISEIYLASSNNNGINNFKEISFIEIKKFLTQFWSQLEVLIFVGSIPASIRLISPFISSKDVDPAVIVMDTNGLNIIPILGVHFANGKNIAVQISKLLGGKVINTSNSSMEDLLNLDSFGSSWGWKRSGQIKDWSTLVINQSKKEKISYKQTSGNQLWKKSLLSRKLNQLKVDNNKQSTFHISTKNNCR